MPNNLRWDLTILLYPNQLPKADFVYCHTREIYFKGFPGSFKK